MRMYVCVRFCERLNEFDSQFILRHAQYFLNCVSVSSRTLTCTHKHATGFGDDASEATVIHHASANEMRCETMWSIRSETETKNTQIRSHWVRSVRESCWTMPCISRVCAVRQARANKLTACANFHRLTRMQIETRRRVRSRSVFDVVNVWARSANSVGHLIHTLVLRVYCRRFNLFIHFFPHAFARSCRFANVARIRFS